MSIASLTSLINRRKKKLLRNASIQTILLASLLMLTYYATKSEMRTTGRRTTSEDLPIMHTFYEKVREGEDDLLEAWKAEWAIAGFEPKVLTLEDAKKHRFFPRMEMFAKPEFGTGYNAMCLYRWLAMAASGGGWMCDYDTFPTNFPMSEARNLPSNGKLTSFELHVPSLLSGTAEQWSIIAEKLIQVMHKVKEEKKSDMHAFEVLSLEGNKHQVDFRVAKLNMREGFLYKKAFSSDLPREVDCEAMAIGRAVHLAHRYTHEAFDRGMFPLPRVKDYDTALHHRGEAARVFMADWRDQCGGSNVK